MPNSKDNPEWFENYMDEMSHPLAATYRKLQHLDSVLRGCLTSENPVYRAAAEMWIAIAEANSVLSSTPAQTSTPATVRGKDGEE